MSSKQTRRSLIIFAKFPEQGKVKTRLGAGLGLGVATQLYAQMLSQTLHLARTIRCKTLVFADSMHSERLFKASMGDSFNLRIQKGVDLGIRMKNAFNEELSRGMNALIIGSDCPLLRTSELTKAFEYLEKNDAVIGPTKDGGYYLIGLNHQCSSMNGSSVLNQLFSNMRWSHKSVYSHTMKRMRKMRLKIKELERLTDIDMASDISAEALNNLYPAI